MTTTALAALMMFGAPQASAQGLFDLLFGEGNQATRQHARPAPEPAAAPEPERTRPTSLPRVSGPSYYEYRTDSLVRVDFSAIKPPVEEARVSTEPAGLLVASTEGFDAEIVTSAERAAGEGIEVSISDEPIIPTIEDAAVLDRVTVAIDGEEADAELAGTDAAAADEASVFVAAEEPEEAETVAAREDREPAAEPSGTDAESDIEALVREVTEEISGADEAGMDTGIAQSPINGRSGDAAAANEAAGEEMSPMSESVEVAAPDIPRLTATKLEALDAFELLAEKRVAEALIEHYSANPDFIWVADGAPNEVAMQALDVLAGADSHGLDPDHYRISVPRGGASEGELARFEMELSARLLRYVRDVHGGRIDPNRISGYHDFELKEIDYPGELGTLASTRDVRAHLNGSHPQNDFYRTLRAELEMLRAKDENDIVIELSGLIRPGHTHAEFPKILELIARDANAAFMAEHGEVLERHLGSDHYAQELVAVIRGAQADRNLQADGVIGPQTVRGLAGESVAGRIEKVKLALERLRWLPSDWTDRFVLLNAPSFRAQYFEGGKEKLNMRAIYGNTSRQTYFFKDRVSYVEFHPFWGVPRSIVVNTYLERLIHDPGYFDNAGFEVTDRRGQRIPSAAIDWGRYGANIPYDVRQRPGPRNALGELKIMFPNRHAIYMHDTPDRHLFDRVNRAISNGCVRLEDPRAMAAAVLGWDVNAIATRLQGPHSREDLDTEVPVYLAYFTAFPEASGSVAYYDDVYGRDSRLAQAVERVQRLRAPSS